MNTLIAKFIALISLSAPAAFAAIPVPGAFTYTQDFNSLPAAAGTNWTNNSTISGWWLQWDGATPPNPAVVRVSNGTDPGWVAGIYSLGATGIAERALGAAPTTTYGEHSSVVIFTNTNASALKISNINYDVEVWRTNSTIPGSETTRFSWKSAATEAILSTPGSGWTIDPMLSIVYPGHGAGSAARPPDVTTVEKAPGTDIILLPEQFLALRWSNSNDSGNDAYMGIDNVTVGFVVMPCTLLASVSGITRQANGTPYEPGDDTFSFNVLVTAFNAGTADWHSTSEPVTFGAYGSAVAVAGLPVSASPYTFTVADTQDSACATSVVVTAPVAELFLDASIPFTEPLEGAENHVWRAGTQDLGWSGGSPTAAVRFQPAPNETAKYFDINNAQVDFTTEPVNISLANEFQVGIDLAGYTTAADGFESSDTLFISVQTAQSRNGPWGFAASIVSGLDGVELFDLIKVSEPGTNYDAGSFPATDFPFVTRRSRALPRGTATHARLVAIGGTDSTTEHLLLDNITFRLVPDIAVEDPNGTALADGAATANFGTHSTGAGGSLTFTVRNTGQGILTGLGVTLDGANPGDFTVTAAPAPTVVAGASSTFTILFSPLGGGPRSAALHLASNDSDENPFDIILTGRGYTSLEGWRLLYFGSQNNTGAGADRSDPDGDGIANLVEFAFAMDPTAADAASMPQWRWDGSNFSIEFTRPAGTDGLIYRAEWSTMLSAGTWTGIPNSATPPQYRFHAPTGTAGRHFVRMRIIAP